VSHIQLSTPLVLYGSALCLAVLGLIATSLVEVEKLGQGLSIGVGLYWCGSLVDDG